MLVAHDSQAIDLSLYYGYAYLILGDPGAVSRVDKMFVVKVYCKIETSSSRCYSKLSPRSFYRPDELPLCLRGCAYLDFEYCPSVYILSK